MGNSTCPVESRAPVDPVPFLSQGNLNFKAHDVGWIVCGFFSCIATIASAWLIWKHLTYYTCPQQQRQIIRMLFMVPIYAILTTFSYIFYHESLYYTTICDCYEAVVITSFFNLVLQYVGDTPSDQIEVFRQVKLKKWFFPLNFWNYRPSGVHFLWLMKIGILQYAVLQPICTLVAVGLQYFGLYCLESWEPYFGHFWISLIVAISISIAMYCIVQIYLPIREEVKPYSPVIKFAAVKAIIFLTFWQNSFLSVLIYFKVIKQTQYFTTGDIQVGINALLVTFEMMVFGFLHIKAFTYVIYRPHDKLRTTKRGKALLDVLDFRDWWTDMKNTTQYAAARSRGRDFTIADGIRNEKHLHLKKAMGRDRLLHLEAERECDKQKMPTFWRDDSDGKENEEDLLVSAVDLEKFTNEDAQMGNGQGIEYGGGEFKEEPGYGHISSPDPSILPALPFINYKISPAGTRGEAERSTRYRHLSTIDVAEEEHLEGESDISDARKGGKNRKEVSQAFGAWWRAFRERVSGEGMNEQFQADDYNEKTNMLAEELGLGFVCDAEVNKEKKRPPLLRDLVTSSVSIKEIQERNSPLSLLVNAHGQKEDSGLYNDACPKVKQKGEYRTVVCNNSQMMARQASTNAALEELSACDPSVNSVEASVSNAAPSVAIVNTPQALPTTKATLQSLGPKGRAIPLVLPQRLSNKDEPFTAASLHVGTASKSSPISNDPASVSSSSSMSTTTAKIQFVYIKPAPCKKIEDDPEAEPTNRAGTVIAGAQSLNARKKQQEEQEKQKWRAQQEQVQLRPSSKKMKMVEVQPYTSLLAPSQMAQVDGRQDPFAAAYPSGSAFSVPGRESFNASLHPARLRTIPINTRTDIRPSLEVGSVTSRQGLQELQRPQRVDQRRVHRPRSSLPPGPIAPTLHQIQQQQRSLPRTNRHSTGSNRPPSQGVALYDRHTGEPSWQPQGQRDSQSRVQSRRQLFEAPPGYQFDFID